MIFAPAPVSRDILEHYGQGLKIDQKVRGDHDCGGPGTLLVSRNQDGLVGYCFRCKGTGFAPIRESLSARLARLSRGRAADAEARAGGASLPRPAVRDPRDWPDHARVWLYKAGLSDTRIKRAGFYYHERMQRVVMPVVYQGKVVYYQARGFDPERPKYINPEVDRSRLAYRVSTPSTHLVLTEDILSAIRVGDAAPDGYGAWSILGTSLTDALANEIADLNVQVIIALDPDGAGRHGASRIRAQLSLLGVNCNVSLMAKDPKEHTRQEIEEWLSFIPD